jgi:hypothetical protein
MRSVMPCGPSVKRSIAESTNGGCRNSVCRPGAAGIGFHNRLIRHSLRSCAGWPVAHERAQEPPARSQRSTATAAASCMAAYRRDRAPLPARRDRRLMGSHRSGSEPHEKYTKAYFRADKSANLFAHFGTAQPAESLTQHRARRYVHCSFRTNFFADKSELSCME